MRRHCILIVFLGYLQIFKDIQGCSPVIEVKGMALRLTQICTAPEDNNVVTIQVSVITNENDSSCALKQFSITSTRWLLFELKKGMTSMTQDIYSKKGTTQSGTLMISGLSRELYAISIAVELNDGENGQDSIVIIGYFSSGCTGSLKNIRITCLRIFNALYGIVEQDFEIRSCGNNEIHYGDPYCSNFEEARCENDKKMDNYCHVGDVVYGKVTEILSDNCVSDEFYIVNNGVWTVGNCEAEFEICIDMTESPQQARWLEWSEWNGCDVTCGEGKQSRIRTCSTAEDGKQACDNAGNSTEYQNCVMQPCPIDGQWSQWSSWGMCNATCGGGTQVRDRTCSDPFQQYGGQPCKNPTAFLERQHCNNQSCPVKTDGLFLVEAHVGDEPSLCETDPCQNEGVCTVTDTGYNCKCMEGFTGSNCEIVDLAQRMFDDVMSFDEEEIFEGPQIIYQPTPCDSNPCQNEGVCTVTDVGYNCMCSEGFTGLSCEIEDLAQNMFHDVVSEDEEEIFGEPRIMCLSNCDPLINPQERVEVYIDCSECSSKIISYDWSIGDCSTVLSCSKNRLLLENNTESRFFTFVKDTSQSLPPFQGIFATVLLQDAEEEEATLIVGYSPIPTAGSCIVSPQTGFALITDFSVTCLGFSVSDGSDLTYTMYANTENIREKAVKLFKGDKSTVSGIKLQEGSPISNHTIYVIVVATTSTGTYVSVTATVQVLPPDQSEEGVTALDLVSSIALGNTGESSSPIEDLLSEGNQDAAVQLIGILSSTINNMNETEDGQTKDLKAEVRSAMVSDLRKVNVLDFETLTSVTAVLNDVTEVKTELTEQAQDEAANLYDGLADSLDVFLNKSTSKSQIIDTAESILKGVTGILDIVTDSGKEKISNGTDSITQLTDSVVEDKATIEKVKKSTGKLLNTLNKVSGSMLTQQLTDQPATVIKAESVTISVQKLSSSRLDRARLSPSDVTEGSSLKFDGISTAFNDTDVGIKMMGMRKNPFIWHLSARDVNSDVLSVDLTREDKSILKFDNLTNPLEISLKIPDSSESTQTTLSLHLVKSNSTLQLDRTKSNMITFNFTVAQGKTTVLKITSVSNITRFRVLVSNLQQPSFLDILESGVIYPNESHMLTKYMNFTLDGQNVSSKLQDVNQGLIYFHHNTSNSNTTQTIYVGITVDINDTESLHQLGKADFSCLGNDTELLCSSVVETPLILETKLLSCTFWDEEIQVWSSEGCEVSPYTSMETLKCACIHLTSFAGGVFVLPNFVDPISDAELFLTFFDNPVVVTTVLIVWIIYFFLVHWARRADRNDIEKVGVLHCDDNDVTHKYNYLVCVVTGWWKEAGTTANVFIYIQGTKGASPRRKLSTGARLCFQTGYEDWFLITTEENLGDISQVTFWHDNSGTSPHWYLSQAYIQDMQTGEGWTFIYNDWLAADRGNILQTTGTVVAVTPEQLKYKQKHNFMVKTVQGFRDSHLWISVFSKPARNSFTRVQRLTCALSLLLTTMLTNIMFYGIPTDEPGDQVGGVGGINLSVSALMIGIQSSLIMFPINLLILQLFIRVRAKSEYIKEKKHSTSMKKLNFKTKIMSAGKIKEKIMKGIFGPFSNRQKIDTIEQQTDRPLIRDFGDEVTADKRNSCSSANLSNKSSDQQQYFLRSRNSGACLPWWFLYVSWCLVIMICLVSSYFVMLYGLKYGYDKSVEWLVSFLTGFTQSAFVVQPMKVISIALLLALILKKTAGFEDLGPNVELEKDEEYLCLTKDHKESHIPHCEPLSARLLQQIRERLKLEWLMNATIRDIILYIIYVSVVMFVVHGHRDIQQAYRNTVAIEDVLVNPGCIKLWQCFYLSKADKVQTFYQYLHDVAIPSLAGMSIADHEYATPGSSHFLVGPYRLRQLRVAKDSCSLEMRWLFDKMGIELGRCSGAYWLGDEDNGNYHLNWTVHLVEEPSRPTHWTHQSAWKLKTIPFTGQLGTYSGGGYVLTMPSDTSLHEGIINDLWNTEWIDVRTRAVLLEFTLYNPNADLFSVAMISFEFSNYGLIIPHHQIFTTKLFHYSTDFGIFVMICEISFLLFNTGFTYIEYKRIRKLGTKEYFSDKWNYAEILQISLSYSIIGLFFQRLISVNSILKDYRASNGQEFVSFYTAVFWDYVLGYIMAFLVFLVTLKFMKLLEFNKRMFMLTDTVSQTKGALLSLIFLVVVFSIAFANFTVIAFGNSLTEYRTMLSSLMALLNFALGVSDFPGLQSANRTLGPIFFFVFVFTVHFSFLTIFIAILNFGINESKTLFMQRTNKFELFDYITAKAKLLINFK